MLKTTFDSVTFCATLKVWRKLNGWGSGEVADLAGIARSTYSFIEQGQRPPTMAEFSHLCHLMDFDAQDFFKSREKVVNGGN